MKIVLPRAESRYALAGMLTGFLPCGLVYAYLALATSTGDMITGGVTMAAFGAGTVPAMVLTGSGASLLSLAGRQRMLRAAAWCVVLVGVISLARGFGFLELTGRPTPANCPLCAEGSNGQTEFHGSDRYDFGS